MRVERAVSLAWLAVLCLGVCAARPSGARAQVFAEELRVKGWWPDLGLTFGAGFGLDHKLDMPVLGRARIGALYAYEPLILSFGVSGELGALARRGLGAEIELTHFGGLWLQVGFERVRGADFMIHTTLGYTILGLEWQHRFSSAVPGDALLFVLRVPIGTWWFLLHDDAERKRAQERRLHPEKR